MTPDAHFAYNTLHNMFSKLCTVCTLLGHTGAIGYVWVMCAANFRQGNKIHVESSVGRTQATRQLTLQCVCHHHRAVTWHKVNEAFSQRHSVAWVISQVPAAVIRRLQLCSFSSFSCYFCCCWCTFRCNWNLIRSRAKLLPTFGDRRRHSSRMSSFNILFAACRVQAPQTS